MLARFMIPLALVSAVAIARPQPFSPAAVDNYVRPYVDTQNFSGTILVAREGKPLFVRAYGMADRDKGIPNALHTRFHIASMSMQFTAAATLRLVAADKITLDTSVANVIPDYPNGQAITVRHLLTQTSGIADINALADYPEVLKSHQTPETLVAKVRDLPPLRKPGTFEREEHSAYNLLALIIEKKTGLPLAEALQKLVFAPLSMTESGIDDDRRIARAATGYEPKGLYEVARADRIRWSAKAGNASAYTTASDELKFVQGLYRDDFMPPQLRQAMFDLGSRVGYGWFKSNSTRFGQPVYSMNGRAPGFASAMIYVPREQLLVVALSNIYASVPADITSEIAAMTLGKPFEALSLKREVEKASLAGLPAAFQFPKDFYQSSAIVRVSAMDGSVTLAWPSGDMSVLIPTAKDRYIDRAYWVPVEVLRDAKGEILRLKYDRFIGERVHG